jgi:inner membrane protein
MDSITHTITGAVIARAVQDEKVGHWGTIAGVTMGIFPDTDFVLGLFSRQSHLEYHRAFTHSLVLLPFYALLFSWIFVRLSRRREFWGFYKICFLVLASHVMLDLFTSYGTMILSPLSNHRFAWDLTFIIDLVFSGIVIIPWLGSLFWKRKARWICRGSLSLLALYILLIGIQHHRAVQLAKDFAASLKEEVLEVASLPQPLSPFRWANYVETGDRVYQGYVDLLGKSDVLSGNDGGGAETDSSFFLGRWWIMKDLYQPPSKIQYSAWQKRDGSPWVEKALATEGGKFYTWFARFPIAKVADSGNGTHRVELTDVRFLVPRIRLPFMYTIEFDDSGRILSEGFSGNRSNSGETKASNH